MGRAGAGAIIPFSSGLPLALSTIAGGLVGTVGVVGFGNSAPSLTGLGGVIDLTGSPGELLNFAFTMPRAGTITSIVATFSTLVELALPATTVTIRAELYRSVTPTSNVFVPTGAIVTLTPSLTGVIVGPGTVSSGMNSGLDIPVAAGDRLLLVFSATAAGAAPIIEALVGYTSAGVNII